MEQKFKNLTNEVLEKLLAGNDPVLENLRQQLLQTEFVNEELTGAGLFLHISLKPTAIALAGEPSLRFGDVDANCLDLKNGAGFLLFVDKGLLSLLEAYSYEESWPPPTSTFHLSYDSGGSRDLNALRDTPGWPKEGATREIRL